MCFKATWEFCVCLIQGPKMAPLTLQQVPQVPFSLPSSPSSSLSVCI